MTDFKLIEGNRFPTLKITGTCKASVIDIIMNFKWAKSRGEAKRLIQQGAVRINDRL